MKAPKDLYKFSNGATHCFKAPSMAMKAPMLILNIQNHDHKLTVLKALKWPSKQLCATTRMGPLRAHNNQTTGLYGPIKGVGDCRTTLSRGPVEYSVSGRNI